MVVWETRCSSITTLRGIADKHGYDFIIPESDFVDEWNDHQLFELSNFLILRIEGRSMTSISKNVSFIFDQELVDKCPDDVSL